jgi:hypothetical protein
MFRIESQQGMGGVVFGPITSLILLIALTTLVFYLTFYFVGEIKKSIIERELYLMDIGSSINK